MRCLIGEREWSEKEAEYTRLDEKMMPAIQETRVLSISYLEMMKERKVLEAIINVVQLHDQALSVEVRHRSSSLFWYLTDHVDPHPHPADTHGTGAHESRF